MSLDSVYDTNWLEDYHTYRQESVSYDNLLNALDHSSFRSQDLVVEWVDEQHSLQKAIKVLSEVDVGPASSLEAVFNGSQGYNVESPGSSRALPNPRHEADHVYNVEFAETDEGLALGARTCSTYGEGYTVVVRNVPMAEAYDDADDDNLADVSAEDIEVLLDGGDPRPSIQESMRRSLDKLKDVARSLRK